MTRELETIDKSLEETVLSEREEYSGRLLHVLRREVKLPDGHISAREMIAHPGRQPWWYSMTRIAPYLNGNGAAL